MEVLTGGRDGGSVPATYAVVGEQWAWSAEWNTEHMRMLAAAIVAFCNLLVVAQVTHWATMHQGGRKKGDTCEQLYASSHEKQAKRHLMLPLTPCVLTPRELTGRTGTSRTLAATRSRSSR